MDRYHQVLERVEAVAPETGSPADVNSALAPDLAALAAAGAQLMDLLARAHEVCLAAQALAPSDGADIHPARAGSCSTSIAPWHGRRRSSPRPRSP